MARMRPHKGRGAWAAVQVFVAAADSEVGVGALQVDRHRAGRMGQVPDHQRAGAVGGGRDGLHVVQVARAVVHLGQHQHGRIVVQDGGNLVHAVDQMQARAVLLGQAFGDVEIGREVAALRDDEPSIRCVGVGNAQRGGQHLVQIHRGRIGDDQFTVAGADQARDLVADAARQIDPAGACSSS